MNAVCKREEGVSNHAKSKEFCGKTIEIGSMQNKDFHGFDLSNTTFNMVDLRGSDFHQAKLKNTAINNCMLYAANLNNINLSEVDLTGSIFTPDDFSNDAENSLNGISFANAVLDECEFTEVAAKEVNFSHADMVSTNF